MRKARPAPALVDRLTGDLVVAWVPRRFFDQAIDTIERNGVSRPSIKQDRIEAVVADGRRGRFRVALTWNGGGPDSRCDCNGKSPCKHAAALAVLMAGDTLPGAVFESDVDPRGAPADEERKRRAERGASELFTVTPRAGTRIYGAYDVASPSSRAYEVVVRALDRPHNGCTCPDFATNLLGTCKHVEAVLHQRRRDAPRQVERAADSGPPESYLHLAFDGGIASVGVRLGAGAPASARRVAARFFDGAGRLASPLVDVWRDLEASAIEHGVEVPREVVALADRALWTAAQERRRGEVEAEIRWSGVDQPGFRAKLYPYQVEGVAFLASRGRALLADDMGLGKTAQAIAAMARLFDRGEARRAVIVCPASLKHQWRREILRFAWVSETEIEIAGGPKERRRAQCEAAPPILITSYELVRTDEAELIALAPDLVILDEAQRIRNWRTQTASVVKRIPKRFVFVLTGTPLENRLDDIYSLVQVIDPHLFGPLWRFNQDFTRSDDRGRVAGYMNLDRLRERLSPVMLRRKKEEVLSELPEKIVTRMSVPLTTAQREIHDEAEETIGRLSSILGKRPLTPVEEKRLMAAFARARMVCDALELVDDTRKGSPKLDELAGLLDEICVQSGRKVVIFTEWERMQQLAAAVCKKLRIGHVRLHGGVPSSSRGGLIDRFRDDPETLAFLSTDAGGVGLNLQVASHVINLDLPWNPAVLAQRIARIHRLGQRTAANVVLLVSEGSIEERIERTLEAKRALFASAVGDDEETTDIERATMATRIATLLGQSFAAPTGREGVSGGDEPPEVPAADPVPDLQGRFGHALDRVLRLPDGRAIAVVHGAGEASLAADGPLVLPYAMAGALAPLVPAEVLYQAPAVDPRLADRQVRIAAAERKLEAAGALIAAKLSGEALGMLRDALALACRSIGERSDPGDDPAALLAAVYADLIPSGLVTARDAHALVRAGELARAFSAVPPPDALVTELVEEARDLVVRARARTPRA